MYRTPVNLNHLGRHSSQTPVASSACLRRKGKARGRDREPKQQKNRDEGAKEQEESSKETGTDAAKKQEESGKETGTRELWNRNKAAKEQERMQQRNRPEGTKAQEGEHLARPLVVEPIFN